MAHRRLRIHDISRYPRLLQTTVPARLSGYAAHDGLLQPNRIPLRHRRHGLGRYCAESAAEWDQRGQHGHGHWTGPCHRLLLLDDSFHCDRSRSWWSLDAIDRRLDGKHALHELWSLSYVQGALLMPAAEKARSSVLASSLAAALLNGLFEHPDW